MDLSWLLQVRQERLFESSPFQGVRKCINSGAVLTLQQYTACLSISALHYCVCPRHPIQSTFSDLVCLLIAILRLERQLNRRHHQYRIAGHVLSLMTPVTLQETARPNRQRVTPQEEAACPPEANRFIEGIAGHLVACFAGHHSLWVVVLPES